MVSGGEGGEVEEEEEVDPERQAMFQAQDANMCPVLWVKVSEKRVKMLGLWLVLGRERGAAG